MIITENSFILNGTVYRKTVSDTGKLIRKIGTNEIYSEAVDLLTTEWSYEETASEIEREEEPSQ